MLLIGQLFAPKCFWSFLRLALLIILSFALGLTVALGLPVGIIAVKQELHITLVCIELYCCRELRSFGGNHTL